MPHCGGNNLARVANSFFIFLCINERIDEKITPLFLAVHFHGVLQGQIHWFWRHIGGI